MATVTVRDLAILDANIAVLIGIRRHRQSPDRQIAARLGFRVNRRLRGWHVGHL
jgi:hypothetical protein